MNRTTRLVAPSTLIIGAGLALAACSGQLNSPEQGVGCSVTVQIPSGPGGKLGTVQARIGDKVQRLHRNVTTLPLSCGTAVRLSAAPTRPGQNPFTGWVVNGQRRAGTSVTVSADGLITATPQFYTPPKPTPSPSPSASPSSTPASVTLDQWLSYDSANKTATLKLVAGYQGVNHGLSYDGEANGKLQVSVPVGWRVVVNFSNAASINHSAAVVTPTGSSPVFSGASSPDPTVGLAPGGSVSFSFVAATAGSYRIACLVPGHEGLGMWATFDVPSSGVPSIHL